MLIGFDYRPRDDPSFLFDDKQQLRDDFTGNGLQSTDAQIDRVIADGTSFDGDESADQLDGGSGVDYLIGDRGDRGDTLTGGEDRDDFETDWLRGDAPVTITDFNPSQGESLAIYCETQASASDFTLDQTATGTDVRLGADTIVHLIDISQDQAAMSNLRIVLPDGTEAVVG